MLHDNIHFFTGQQSKHLQILPMIATTTTLFQKKVKEKNVKEKIRPGLIPGFLHFLALPGGLAWWESATNYTPPTHQVGGPGLPKEQNERGSNNSVLTMHMRAWPGLIPWFLAHPCTSGGLAWQNLMVAEHDDGGRT